MAFAIDDLASVLGHWSADDITGLSDGDAVSTWIGSVGGNLTGVTTTRPLWRPTGIDSQPSVQFDGTDDVMSSAGITIDGQLAVAVVTSCDALKNYNGAYNIHSTTTPTYPPKFGGSMQYGNGTILFGNAPVSQHNYITNSAVVSATVPILTVYGVGDITTLIQVDGKHYGAASSAGDSVRTSATGTGYVHLGTNAFSGSWFDGHIAEIVVFHVSVVATEWLYIEAVLAHKYGITLPSSHPFNAAPPTSGPPSAGGGIQIARGMSGGMR